ncbi:hypothetical protein BaRGS_00025589, partial [Batillaria attramentaria]
ENTKRCPNFRKLSSEFETVLRVSVRLVAKPHTYLLNRIDYPTGQQNAAVMNSEILHADRPIHTACHPLPKLRRCSVARTQATAETSRSCKSGLLLVDTGHYVNHHRPIHNTGRSARERNNRAGDDQSKFMPGPHPTNQTAICIQIRALSPRGGTAQISRPWIHVIAREEREDHPVQPDTSDTLPRDSDNFSQWNRRHRTPISLMQYMLPGA